MRRLILYVGLAGMLFGACRKGELPVAKADRGQMVERQMDMGANYKNQIWYKLNGNTVVNTNNRGDWDLAFESGDNGNHIRLNSAKYMFAMNTFRRDFDNITINDTVGFSIEKRCDGITTLDSTVLGIFENNSPVFIIDMGMDDDNKPIGLRKLQFLENTPQQFHIKYAEMDGKNMHDISFSKDNNYSFLYFSMMQNILQTGVGAPKEKFDLQFTQYTNVFQVPFYIPYSLVGVLLNPYKVTCCKVYGKHFENVSLKDTLSFKLSQNPIAIGYDWKTYNPGPGNYTITTLDAQGLPDPNGIIPTYILRDVDGYYFKLRFIDYYNGGMKGFPKFEVQKL